MPSAGGANALEMVARTDCGKCRTNNEDSVFADAALGLAILADGMGGYRAGEIASGMLTSLLATQIAGLLPACQAAAEDGELDGQMLEEHLVRQVKIANNAIFAASLNEPEKSGMGTTLVLAWFYNQRMIVAHVGDSRLYRLREGVFSQLTRDHSLIQDYLDSGWLTEEEAERSESRGLLTRAIGIAPWVEVDVAEHDVCPGDLLLLCSDGLNGMLEDEMIADTLQTFRESPEMAASALVQIANDYGGEDNISVILVKVHGGFYQSTGDTSATDEFEVDWGKENG